MGLLWLDQYLQQCHYYNPHGNNLYDEIGNPLFLSQDLLSADSNPLELQNYTIEQIPTDQLQELFPDIQKKPGDVLSLDVHGFGKYYLSLMRIPNTNQPLCDKNGYFIYQMFANPHLTKPSYNQYYWERYKKYSDDIDSHGASCIYIHKSKKQQGVQYSIPSTTTKINLPRATERELFNHRIARPIKVPYCEPPFISPISPPITIEYDEFNIFAWFNRILYFIFSTPEGVFKLSGLTFNIIFGTIGSTVQQVTGVIQSVINVKITTLTKNPNKLIINITKFIYYITYPLMAILYIIGLSITHIGCLLQTYANFFASLVSIFTYYFRAGGIEVRIRTIYNQTYCIFAGMLSTFILLPTWIGDIFTDNYKFKNIQRTQKTKPNKVSLFIAKLFYAISVMIQGILELTGGIADIEAHYHNIAIIDSFFKRYFSIISNYVDSWLKIITATVKDMKTNFYTNEDGLIIRRTTEINNTLTNINHRDAIFTSWYKPLGENTSPNTTENLTNFNIIPDDVARTSNLKKSEENTQNNTKTSKDSTQQNEKKKEDTYQDSKKQNPNPETMINKMSTTPNNSSEKQKITSTIPA